MGALPDADAPDRPKANPLRTSSLGCGIGRRITVTPGHVEVLALTSDDDHDIADFLERKRQWVFNTVREMERVISNRHAVPRFMTGSKILFRGRRMNRPAQGEELDYIAIQQTDNVSEILYSNFVDHLHINRVIQVHQNLVLKFAAQRDVDFAAGQDM
nr:DUF45 domain-containing protein [Mesorhizobium sangaii]